MNPTIQATESKHSVETPYRLAADVLLVSLPDGSARLVDLHGKFFALTDVAAAMLQETLTVGPAAAAESIARRWSIDVRRARTDLDGFVAGLLNRRLLVGPRTQRAARHSVSDWPRC